MKKTEIVANDIEIDLLDCVLKSIYDCVVGVGNRPLHNNIDTEIIVKTDKSFTSKAGNFYEKAIKQGFLKSERFTVLKEAKGKNKNIINIPKHLYTFVDSCISKVHSREINLNNLEDFQNLFFKLYEYASVAKCQSYLFEDMIEKRQDMDLGICDNITGDIYLFEIKKYGSFGADVFFEHFRKYLLTYVNYVYNNIVSFDKLHLNFLLVEREDDVFKFFIKSDIDGFGWICFSDFCEYFIRLSSDLEFLNRIKKPIINDEEVERIIKRGKFVINSYPQLKQASFKKFKDSYLTVYNI